MVFKLFPTVFNRFSNGFQRFSNNSRIWLNVTLKTSVSEIFVGVRAHLAHNALTLLKRNYRKDCTVFTVIIFSNLGARCNGCLWYRVVLFFQFAENQMSPLGKRSLRVRA